MAATNSIKTATPAQVGAALADFTFAVTPAKNTDTPRELRSRLQCVYAARKAARFLLDTYEPRITEIRARLKALAA